MSAATAATYVALLRGVNVSGRKPIAMAALRRSCDALGLAEVRTYLQSGNVVFGAGKSTAPRLAAALRARIADDFGHDVEVLVLPAQELAGIAAANPLRPASGEGAALFLCTFLFRPVGAERFRALALPAQPGERAALVGQAVFLHCPHGYGRTKLNNTYFERALGVPATTRNWRTVLALRDLAVGSA